MPTELEAALEYSRRGIPVFPCNPLDKRPLTPRGFKNATRDETQIRAWWQKWPDAMIGAPTGPTSGMWVVDLDLDLAKKIDGKATLDQLIAQRGPIPDTLQTITPRGGQHIIFNWDNNTEIRNSAGKIGPGIDVRAHGGYICLPPSKNAGGGEYRWVSNGVAQPAAAPSWLIALAKATKAKTWAKAALERECKAVASAQPGTRNTTLNTAAFNLFQIVAGGGLDEQEVRDRLFEAAETCRLVADDGAASVEATIDSGAEAGRKQPRTRPQPPSQGARPTVQIMDGQLLRILSETEDALLASGLPIFSRAGMLVEPVAREHVGIGWAQDRGGALASAFSRIILRPGCGVRSVSKIRSQAQCMGRYRPATAVHACHSCKRTALAVSARHWRYYDPDTASRWFAARRPRP